MIRQLAIGLIRGLEYQPEYMDDLDWKAREAIGALNDREHFERLVIYAHAE